MKKKYVSPESEVINFAIEDVVTDGEIEGGVPGLEGGIISDPEFVNPFAIEDEI